MTNKDFHRSCYKIFVISWMILVANIVPMFYMFSINIKTATRYIFCSARPLEQAHCNSACLLEFTIADDCLIIFATFYCHNATNCKLRMHEKYRMYVGKLKSDINKTKHKDRRTIIESGSIIPYHIPLDHSTR